MGVVAVIASMVATTTHVYPVWLPWRSLTMRGSALDTTVLDSIATNIASSRPLRASRIWRWVIWPDSAADTGAAETGAAGAGDAWDTEARFTMDRRLPTATIFPNRCHR